MLLPTAPDPRDEDARLVARLRAGDERAFDAIVARHRPRLLRFARSILRSRPDAAEDVVQEALMRAHRALLRDDRMILLGPWLSKLTRNCALDEISRVKADTVPLDAPPALVALIDGNGPAQVHERRANVRSMLEGIATLPEEQRHALLRREVDGASHADIASELGISGAASRALVHRARINLTKRDEAL
jgi:RNA polymerase sigma factor (sigma-70 family)